MIIDTTYNNIPAVPVPELLEGEKWAIFLVGEPKLERTEWTLPMEDRWSITYNLWTVEYTDLEQVMEVAQAKVADTFHDLGGDVTTERFSDKSYAVYKRGYSMIKNVTRPVPIALVTIVDADEPIMRFRHFFYTKRETPYTE